MASVWAKYAADCKPSPKLAAILEESLKRANPKLYEELDAAGDVDNYIAVKADECASMMAEFVKHGMDESEAQELAMDGLIPSELEDISRLDDDGGGEEDAAAALMEMLGGGDAIVGDEQDGEEHLSSWEERRERQRAGLDDDDDDEDEELPTPEATKKMALQVGMVVNKGGHEYVLNDNHQWTRKDAEQPKQPE